MTYKTKKLNDSLDLLAICERLPILRMDGLVGTDMERGDRLKSYSENWIKIDTEQVTITEISSDQIENGLIILRGWRSGEEIVKVIDARNTIRWFNQTKGKPSRKHELFLVCNEWHTWKILDFLE